MQKKKTNPLDILKATPINSIYSFNSKKCCLLSKLMLDPRHVSEETAQCFFRGPKQRQIGDTVTNLREGSMPSMNSQKLD